MTTAIVNAPVDHLVDVLIVGGGSAGLSAALVLGRARRTILVVDDGAPRNGAAKRMYGFLSRDGTPPAELRALALAELDAYPSVRVRRGTVADIRRTASGRFHVIFADDTSLEARRILVATGVFDALPSIEGLAERWGRSVFVCPFCDGWEVRERRIAISGRGREAIELAQELHGWSTDLVVCPDRDDLTSADRAWIAASGATLAISRIARLDGPGTTLTKICLENGDAFACDALFVSAPLRQHSPIFAKLGVHLEPHGAIEVDANGATNIPGCFAAGDAVETAHQVIIAAASGARAAIGLVHSLLEDDARSLIERGACSTGEPVEHRN